MAPKFWRTTVVIAAVSLAGMLYLTGCSHNSSQSSGDHGVAIAPPPPAIVNPPVGPGSQSTTLVAYKLADSESTTAPDANGLAPTPIAPLSGTQSPAKTALTDLTSGSNSPLPRGTRVLGLKIDPASKLATVDFSREFTQNFQGGETKEAQAVMSVLETLGQFPDVNKVQFLVDGRKIDSLGGTQELDEPLPTPQSTDTVASTNGAGGA